MGKGPEQTLLPGGHTEGPETYERILNINEHILQKQRQKGLFGTNRNSQNSSTKQQHYNKL